MNLPLLKQLLQKYFVYIGIQHKFAPGERFAHIDLDELLNELEDEAQETPRLEEMTDWIEKWDGEFSSMWQYEVALKDCTDKLLQDINLSQAVLLKKWQRYRELTGGEELEVKDGTCRGISMTSGIEYFPLAASEKLEEIFAGKLIDFENLIATVNSWDGKKLTKDINQCFAVLEKITLLLQEEQFKGFEPVAGRLEKVELPAPALTQPFVHNQETLRALFAELLQPGVFICFGASNHAGRAFVTRDEEIIYYNPNERYGYLQFDLQNIDYFLKKLPDGFGNCYPERFALNTRVFDATGENKFEFDAEGLFNQLLKMRTKDSSNPKQVINTVDSRHKTALMLAAYNADPDGVKYILKHNPDVNVRDIHKNCAMVYAIYRSHYPIVDMLLEHGAKMNALYTDNDLAPIHMAVMQRDKVLVKMLAQHRSVDVCFPTGKKSIKPGSTALHIAVDMEEADIVRTLIAADKNIIEIACKADGLTPLEQAVQLEHFEMAMILLANNASVVNLDGEDAESLLNYMSENSDDELVKRFVVERGEDLNLLVEKENELYESEEVQSSDSSISGDEVRDSFSVSPHEKSRAPSLQNSSTMFNNRRNVAEDDKKEDKKYHCPWSQCNIL